MKSTIEIFPDLSEISWVAAEKFISIGNEAVKQNGKFTVALAGGSTPKSLYRLLTTEDFRKRIDWSRVFFFFGDERNVLPDDEESNFRMANENLLKPLQISENQIFRWQTQIGDAEKIAEDYEEKIKDFFKLRGNPSAVEDASDFLLPRFDLLLLGMGDDGHTASLFPFTDALRERKKIAVSNPVEKLNTVRLTLTFPAINNASNVMFLINGEGKADVLRVVLEGEFKPEKFPSQNIKPANGNLFWLVDQKAAEFIICH
jgi:6-phosphogluconolactonase